MPQFTSKNDRDEIRRTLQRIAGPAWERGDVVELRALNAQSGGTVVGYFDAGHLDQFVEAAAEISGKAAGVYITLNPVKRDCLARAANRIKRAKDTSSDPDITHRHWLLIDTDPKRPRGISSNDAEHERALERAKEIRAWLQKRGWPLPLYADSGNGGHLLYRVDLPADDGELLERVLKSLAEQFNDDGVSVDRSVHNPARISKLYGTLACKGDELPDRPHRLARLLEVPEHIEIVSREQLESIVGVTIPRARAASNGQPAAQVQQDFDVVGYLKAHNVEVGKSKPYADGGTLWELKQCPWRPAESDGGSFVIQFVNGNIAAGCNHSKCAGKGWDDLRDEIDPSWRKANGHSPGKKGPSVADQLVALSADDDLFHTAEGRPYATIRKGHHSETWPIDSDFYRLILTERLYRRNIIANDKALDDATRVLECRAIIDGPIRSIHVRTAEHSGKMYIDLCDDEWEAVEVGSDGWRIITDPPVRFVRYPGMLPLPRPVTGGKVDELRKYINVTDSDWPLLVGWIIGALRPRGPYPILWVSGEQGSCKSTACRYVRSLVDPNGAPLRDVPRDTQNLMIWAKNSHVIGLDNLSDISKDLSNAMCRLATGGGYSQKKNYKDDEESQFYSIRPQLVNGIGEIATRSDFLQRSLRINLPVIPKSQRKTEKELDARFADVRPSIFGALLTAMSHGQKHLPEVEQTELDLPRLADFAVWVIAVEEALGWPPGTFKEAMRRTQSESNDLAISASPVAEAIRLFVLERKEWTGKWSTLFEELNKCTEERIRKAEDWPKNATWLSTRLREVAPNLREIGLDIDCDDKARPKTLTLRIRQAAGKGSGGLASGDLSPYLTTPHAMSYGMDKGPYPDEIYKRLLEFWKVANSTTVPVAPVAIPSLTFGYSDGTQAHAGL
jgi:hypothetical protein